MPEWIIILEKILAKVPVGRELLKGHTRSFSSIQKIPTLNFLLKCFPAIEHKAEAKYAARYTPLVWGVQYATYEFLWLLM